MSTGSHVLVEESVPLASRKSSESSGNFLLSLFVVAVGAALGVAGGIWLAERDWSARKSAATSRPVSSKISIQTMSMESVRRKPDLPSPQVTGSKPVTRKADARTIPLGLPSVPSIHHSYQLDYTVLDIEVRSAVLLRAAQLHHPERVYFDLADSRSAREPKGRLKSRKEVLLKDARVAGVRAAGFESGAVRIVVDLKHPCDFTYRVISKPLPRIALELRTRRPGA